jgi:predicted unusual protein kinase regulating ubiquinone biosynthesis (AarF/ABC1/UbiB family)
MDTQSAIPQGKMKRGSTVGKAIVKMGGRKIASSARSLLKSKDEKSRESDRLNEAMANDVFDALVSLRGTALKAAQLICLEFDILPKQFQAKLAHACYAVPPMNRAMIRKVLIQEWEEKPEDLFKSFESEAFAAASIGQVHRAETHAGDQLAIKVQYPGVDRSIQDDMGLAKSLLNSMLPQYVVNLDHATMSQSLDEISARLIEEVNYEKERENLVAFQKGFSLKNVVIPKLYEEYSTAHIIATEFLPGKPLAVWMKENPSQKERNRVGQIIHDIISYSMWELKRLHADPNPGNFIIMDDGNVGLIDFGCVRDQSDDYLSTLRLLVDNYVDHFNPHKIRQIYVEKGMLDCESDLPDSVLNEFRDYLIIKFKSSSTDFSNLPGFAKQGMEIYQRMPIVRPVYSEFTYFERAFFGVHRILEALGATINARRIWFD